MIRKISLIVVAGILFLGLLSGCSDQPAAPTPPSNVQPDSVQIQTGGTEKGQTVTLKNQALVRQLYATSYKLAVLPKDQPCTTEYGPSYVLTFRHNAQTLAAITAERYGCQVVTIGQEQVQLTANATFWKQLDQALQAATP